jgi:hypothetical protein
VVTLHLEASGADAVEGALEVLTSAGPAVSREAKTLIDVCGEEKEGIPVPKRRQRAHQDLEPIPAVTV